VDYPAESELGALSKDLLNDLERVRLGFPEGASPEQVRAAVDERVRLRLDELYRERFADDPGPEAAVRLALYRREIDQILVPRYAALVQRDNHAERTRPRPWTGADAVNRASYAALFFIIGIFVVWAPFIPVWEKWIPFAAGGLASLIAPVLPDLSRFGRRRRFRLALLKLLIDIDQAGAALPEAPDVALLGGPASIGELPPAVERDDKPSGSR
jgi:hypothetical protein